MKKSASGFFLIFMVSSLTLAWAGDNEVSDKPAKHFFYRCASCHTVGGGPLSGGPDLIAATRWQDADLAAGVKRMEKNVGAMTAEEIEKIVQFLKSPDVNERIENQKRVIEASRRATLPPASFEMGQRLFRGQKVFQNGGLACIACHRMGNEGGTLGPDLTTLKATLSGVAMQSAIENSSYKVMRPLYEHRKITSEEALHLAEYLSHPEKIKDRFAADIELALYLATAGFGVSFILLWFLNQKRKLSARKNLFQKNMKGSR